MKSTFGRYFRSHFRDNLKSLVIISLVLGIFTFVYSSTGQMTTWEYFLDSNTVETHKFFDCMVGIPVTILGIAAYVVPVMEFSIFKKRKNLDCLYSMPISRRQTGIIHFLNGLFTLVVPYTLCYIINGVLLLRYPGEFDLSVLPGMYFICLGIGLCMYSILTFLYNQANTSGDGIWFMILGSFAVALVATAVDDILWEYVYDRHSQSHILQTMMEFDPSYGILFWSLGEVSSCLIAVVEKNRQLHTLWTDYIDVYWLVFWTFIGAASLGGFVYTFGKQPMEKTEEISTSAFGFKTMIPLYGYTGRFFLGNSLVIPILAVVGYTIYRRGFHYKTSDVVHMILITLLTVIIGI